MPLRIDHVGFIVPDLDKAVAHMKAHYGIRDVATLSPYLETCWTNGNRVAVAVDLLDLVDQIHHPVPCVHTAAVAVFLVLRLILKENVVPIGPTVPSLRADI